MIDNGIYVIVYVDYFLDEYVYGKFVDEYLVLWNCKCFNVVMKGESDEIFGVDKFIFGYMLLVKLLLFKN